MARMLEAVVRCFHYTLRVNGKTSQASKVVQLPMQETQETQVRPLVQEDPLELEMATHSSTLAWKIPRLEDPRELQSIGLQRVGHGCATEHKHTKATEV